MRKKPKPHLTRQQREVARLMGKGDTAKAAMLKVGYAKTSANSSTKMTSKPQFQELLQKYGPKLNDAFQVTKEAMHATISKPRMMGRDSFGKPIYEYVDEDDHTVRLKAAEQTYKLHGVIQSEGNSAVHNGDNNQFNIYIEPGSPLATTLREIRPGDMEGSETVQNDQPSPEGT